MSDWTAEALENGSLIMPDAQIPLHQYYAGIVAELSKETGTEASFYLVPTVGDSDKERHLSRLRTSVGFRAFHTDATIKIPESAEYFFTRDEIKAVLTHEFEHLKQGEMHNKAQSLIDTFVYVLNDLSTHRNNDFSAITRLDSKTGRRPLTDEEKADHTADYAKRAETLSKLYIEEMVECELKADDAVVKTGRESDFISALQKMNLIVLTLDEQQSGKSPEKSQWVVDVPPEDLARWMENRHQRIASSSISFDEATHPECSPEAARTLINTIAEPHYHYSYVERIKKLEDADKNRDDKSRGR